MAGELPLLVINPFLTETDKSEQRGFANLVKGLFGMFRNPTAHIPKISWAVNKEDAEEVFTLLSLVHIRAIDVAHPADVGKQPGGQISKNLSSPSAKNIPLNPSGKSVL